MYRDGGVTCEADAVGPGLKRGRVWGRRKAKRAQHGACQVGPTCGATVVRGPWAWGAETAAVGSAGFAVSSVETYLTTLSANMISALLSGTARLKCSVFARVFIFLLTKKLSQKSRQITSSSCKIFPEFQESRETFFSLKGRAREPGRVYGPWCIDRVQGGSCKPEQPAAGVNSGEMPRGAAGDGGAASRAREDRQLRFSLTSTVTHCRNSQPQPAYIPTEGRIVVKEKPGVPLLASQ